MEMEVSDMLDVIHFFFEEDLNFTSGEQAEAQSKMRTEMYQTMYGVEYKYPMAQSNTKQGFQTSATSNFDFEPEDEATMAAREIKPFDPLKPPTKAFVPATDFDVDSAKPFGTALDAPLG
jgi:hypothetical protein